MFFFFTFVSRIFSFLFHADFLFFSSFPFFLFYFFLPFFLSFFLSFFLIDCQFLSFSFFLFFYFFFTVYLLFLFFIHSFFLFLILLFFSPLLLDYSFYIISLPPISVFLSLFSFYHLFIIISLLLSFSIFLYYFHFPYPLLSFFKYQASLLIHHTTYPIRTIYSFSSFLFLFLFLHRIKYYPVSITNLVYSFLFNHNDKLLSSIFVLIFIPNFNILFPYSVASSQTSALRLIFSHLKKHRFLRILPFSQYCFQFFYFILLLCLSNPRDGSSGNVMQVIGKKIYFRKKCVLLLVTTLITFASQ